MKTPLILSIFFGYLSLNYHGWGGTVCFLIMCLYLFCLTLKIVRK